MRTIGWLAAAGSLLASFVFMIVSLNRWEWNRALFFGLIFLIAEVALATALVLRRLATLELRVAPDPETLTVLRDTRPSRDRFAWLRSSTNELNVFITFLIGGGAIVSALAWCVDHFAARTSVRLGEDRLARRLVAISYPRGGLLVDDVVALAHDVSGYDDHDVTQLLRNVPHGR